MPPPSRMSLALIGGHLWHKLKPTLHYCGDLGRRGRLELSMAAPELQRMAKHGFLKRHRIVRNAIREDILCFAVPWVFVLFAGMGVSAWDLVRQQGSLYILSVQSIVGLALIIIGFTILLVAQVTLWRFYSSTLVIKEDHQLITHGIYRLTRHPIYLGNIMFFIGVPVYASSLYGLLTMSALIPVFLNRIRIEERLLTDEFGDAYRTYKETTSKLIPFIY